MVSAYEFELHAGSKTRHPNNHVYLENGKPIHSIVEELKSAPLSAVDSVIKAVAGSSVNEEYYQIWKGIIPTKSPFSLKFIQTECLYTTKVLALVWKGILHNYNSWGTFRQVVASAFRSKIL